jgi:crossover junction endodeoxyribonuclease RuvC
MPIPNKMIIGIDPGANGAMAVLDGDRVTILDVPKVAGEIDYVAWAKEWGAVLPFLSHIWIEQVGAMPGQGVTSMFNFGQVYGFVKALAYASGTPVSFVRPQKWKVGVGITAGAAKGASRIRASQLFPQHADLWKLVKHDGRAEALLIAYYGSLK